MVRMLLFKIKSQRLTQPSEILVIFITVFMKHFERQIARASLCFFLSDSFNICPPSLWSIDYLPVQYFSKPVCKKIFLLDISFLYLYSASKLCILFYDKFKHKIWYLPLKKIPKNNQKRLNLNIKDIFPKSKNRTHKQKFSRSFIILWEKSKNIGVKEITHFS